MERLLKKFDVKETFTGAGLVLRCFIILMDLNKDSWYQDEQIQTFAEVKVEALSDEEEIINENTGNSIEDFELTLGSVDAVSDFSADSDDENLHGFFIPKKSRLESKPVKRRVKRIGEDGYHVSKKLLCNGKGCKCGMSFGSQTELVSYFFITKSSFDEPLSANFRNMTQTLLENSSNRRFKNFWVCQRLISENPSQKRIQ